jgi:hypothetical protein
MIIYDYLFDIHDHSLLVIMVSLCVVIQQCSPWQDCVAVIPSSVLEDDLAQWDPHSESHRVEYARVKCFFTFRIKEQPGRDALHEPIQCAFVQWFDPFADTRSPPGRFMGRQGEILNTHPLPCCIGKCCVLHKLLSMVINCHLCWFMMFQAVTTGCTA